MTVKHHPEHTGLKHFEMVERNFAQASRDTGDVPTRITPMVPAYYYEDLLDKLAALQRDHAAVVAQRDARVAAMERAVRIERAKFESAVTRLCAITGMLHPDSIHLPDGRVMQFVPPPESVLQYWMGLSRAIREARTYVDAALAQPDAAHLPLRDVAAMNSPVDNTKLPK